MNEAGGWQGTVCAKISAEPANRPLRRHVDVVPCIPPGSVTRRVVGEAGAK